MVTISGEINCWQLKCDNFIKQYDNSLYLLLDCKHVLHEVNFVLNSWKYDISRRSDFIEEQLLLSWSSSIKSSVLFDRKWWK